MHVFAEIAWTLAREAEACCELIDQGQVNYRAGHLKRGHLSEALDLQGAVFAFKIRDETLKPRLVTQTL